MDGFQPGREQDAWAALKGFRYQIDLTLLRWLALEANQCLELERGEDIDLVAKALSEESQESFIRTLEQVKLRDRTLTLRSEAALEVLANAVQHRLANRHVDLRFCYTTNAAIGKERPSPFPRHETGIGLWEQIRRHELAESECSDVISALRGVLIAGVKPPGVRSDNWRTFIEFITNSDETELRHFIERFEWSCQAAEAEVLTEAVHRQLGVRCGATEDQHVEVLYQRLFLCVLRLLTQPGIKRLTRQDCEAQLERPTLSQSDHLLLARLQSRFAHLEFRVEELDCAIVALNHEVENLTKRHGGGVSAIDVVGHVSLEPPPLVQQLSGRRETVSTLAEILRRASWLALYGSWNTGKSQLSALLAQHLRTCRGWLRFQHDMPLGQVTTVLHESLRVLTGVVPDQISTAWYSAACSRLGSGSLIVLDDLPAIDGDSAVADRLAFLADCCRRANVKLISTSRYRLSTRLATNLESALVELATPQFTDSEFIDVFKAYGAPAPFLAAKHVVWLNGLASGHPLLITLAARYLKEQNWQLDEAQVTALLRGDHASGIVDEIIRDISKSLDPPQRDLLYRLSLATRPIPNQVAIELADVNPQIERARECLAALFGAWLQMESPEKLAVCPVVRGLSQDTLPIDTLQSCHLVLGDSIASRRMDPWDAQIAVNHFVQARAYDRAGSLFLTVLDLLRRKPALAVMRPLLTTWSSIALPEQMSFRIRLIIRAMQFWVFPKYGRSDAFALTDLDALMQRLPPEDAPVGYIVASLAAFFLSPRDFPRSLRYFSVAISACRGRDIDRRQMLLPRGRDPVELLWASVSQISAANHVSEWMRAFETLTEEEKRKVADSGAATLGCTVLADRLLLVESKKPEHERDWSSVLKVLSEVQEFGQKHRWDYMTACALRSEVNVRGEFLKNLEPCKAKVVAFVENPAYSAPATGLVAGMFGRMLAAARRHEDALPWLDRAIHEPPHCLPHDQMMTLLAAAKTCGADFRDRRIEYARKAAAIAKGSRSIPDVEAAKAFAELAIAVLGVDATPERAVEAYEPWAEAAKRLLTISKRDDGWRDTFVLFAHVHGFLVSLATTGEKLDSAFDGSESSAPMQGMFNTTNPARLACFHEESVPGVMWLQSEFAQYVGDDASASAWLQRAGSEVEGLPLTHITASVRREMIPDLLLANRFDVAIDAALRGAEAMVAVKEEVQRSETRAAIPHGTLLDVILARTSDQGRRRIDQFAVSLGVIPSLLRVAVIGSSNPEKGEEIIRQLTVLCRQVASTSADSRFWLGSADVFDLLNKRAPADQLRELAISFDSAVHQEIRILGYAGVTMHGDPKSVFESQIASMQFLFSLYPPKSQTQTKLLVPFVEKYWTTALREQRFHFRSPSMIEGELAKAVTLPPSRRVKAVLRAVRPAFSGHGLEGAIAWLNTEE